MNADGSLLLTSADGQTLKGTYTRDGNGNITFTYVDTTGKTQTTTGTINSAGCLVVAGSSTPLCQTKPAGTVGNANGGVNGITRTLVLYAPSNYTGSLHMITINPNGTWAYTDYQGRTTSGTYTIDSSGTLTMTAPGVSGTPITATGTITSAGCLSVAGSTNATFCPQ